jgi:hypothetical protein
MALQYIGNYQAATGVEDEPATVYSEPFPAQAGDLLIIRGYRERYSYTNTNYGTIVGLNTALGNHALSPLGSISNHCQFVYLDSLQYLSLGISIHIYPVLQTRTDYRVSATKTSYTEIAYANCFVIRGDRGQIYVDSDSGNPTNYCYASATLARPGYVLSADAGAFPYAYGSTLFSNQMPNLNRSETAGFKEVDYGWAQEGAMAMLIVCWVEEAEVISKKGVPLWALNRI